ncbi:Polysaccharide pyruvyl transferase [Roseivivax jejudonensis]|uniref:Polysaccharide pyruvyl transferase n=1 Tax=Roseivivax jejudonensis TaxID=1529041 RepID=A0A1X6ZK71_9RHOB|nr:polysaccharide pyruvyl transferase family protein [Roseivivax jejudonensis]SLN53438.1 Polysaccharide pyruvyl transferase [Roseivivax jejudonensis]
MDTSGSDSGTATILCMNVKYSPNLGDGLLSECLEAALIARGAAPGTTSADLAGRQAYGEGMAGRGAAMRVLDALPGPVRHRAVRVPLALKARSSWAPRYRAALASADAAVIGGGNLLSDHDLNFPTKLALALDAARAACVPVALYACGMGAAWSAEGDRRLRRALAAGGVRAVFLRDAASCARWDARFADVTGLRAERVRDPGLLACDTYDVPARGARDVPHVGLGLMSDIAIRYHADTRIGAAALLDWYVGVTRALVARGARVTAFTNGAPEDRATAATLRAPLTEAGAMVAQPETPAALAALLAGCDALAAFRMHAVIGAYSFGVPALALAWDDKLDAFMESVERADWMADAATLPPEAVADRLIRAAAEGVPAATHRAVIDAARSDVGRLYAAIGAPLRRSAAS